MVTKNEAHRYLDAATRHALSYLDGLLVFDDNSTDQTCSIASDNGALVLIKPEEIPAFLEHEGAFRQASLEALERVFSLKKNDWILVIDADEFMAAADIRNSMEQEIAKAEQRQAWSALLGRKEIWAIDDGRFLMRVDGQWGGMRCTRLFKWRSGGQIEQKKMGCGNEPTYIRQAPMSPVEQFEMLHFGYLDQHDAVEKYNRYTTLLDHGHDDSHIQSIAAQPTLVEWDGVHPPLWRGVKKES